MCWFSDQVMELLFGKVWLGGHDADIGKQGDLLPVNEELNCTSVTSAAVSPIMLYLTLATYKQHACGPAVHFQCKQGTTAHIGCSCFLAFL